MEQKFNLKTLGVIIVWIGVLIGVAYFVPFKKILPSVKNGGNNAVVNMTSVKLSASEKEYDFGDVSMANGKVKHSYQLKNEGSGDLNVEAVWTSCMCTVAEIKTKNGRTYGPFGMSGHGGSNKTDFKIAAGEEFELISEFDPNAHGPDATGPIQRVVFVKTDADKEPLGLLFMANVIK